MPNYKEPLKLRVYQGKGNGLFYVISGAPCPVARADCFSKGFATRKEARAFANKITAKWEQLGRLIPLYYVSRAPCYFPDNGQAEKHLHAGHPYLATLNQLEA